ncbi:MAG: N-acetylmuramoyl-L-alanine amidase [Phenylobacterium sp.]|uniref:N-acetylmuramoyl-L-alanine amidase family protein n=1 Tax=Phenylobacterium sp. TaxID=1871053 RepID=UPI00391D1E5C
MLARLGGIIRRRSVRAAVVAAGALSCLAAVAVSQAAVANAGVLKVRLGGDRNETRIVIDLERSASGKVAADGADRRLVMSLAGVDVEGGLQGSGHGLVKSWTLEDAPGGARLNVDLSAEASIKRRFLLPPADGVDYYRYVIDVAAKAPVKDGQVRLTSAPVKAPPLSLKRVIVIDAGHGGKDPGARGAASNEKDINLAAARALKARLEKSGRYKVVMTRDSDVYVPLESRVQIARRADADLFISLHADSGPTTDLRGASVYTLSEKAAGRSAQFVNRDDWFMKASLAGGGVSDILLDLTQRATKNRSAMFAEALLERIDDEVQLLRRSHREAGLVVLLAPDVPAVLLEMGFVNNKDDEALLRDPARRAQFMDAVGDSIDDYFSHQTRLAAR